MYHTLIITGLVSSITLLTACGGGGGGDSDNSLKYDGVTTAAPINHENSKIFANFLAQQDSTFIGSAVGATTEQVPRALGVISSLAGVTRFIESDERNAFGATVNETEGCSGGGSIQYHLDVNENTGNFSGSFAFNNCREEGETINGTMEVDGVINVKNADIESMNIDTELLTIDGLFAMGGDVSCLFGEIPSPFPGEDLWNNYNPLDAWCNSNLVFEDNTSGKMFKYEDFETTFLNQFSVETTPVYLYIFQGRVYHSDIGYIDLREDDEGYASAISYDVTDSTYPYIMDAQFGDANQQVIITVTDEQIRTGTYTIYIDINKDGTIDEEYVEAWD